MKLLFTRENRFEVSAMRAFLESHGISSFLKNEYSASVMGDIPFFQAWPEIWVSDDIYSTAKELIDGLEEQTPRANGDQEWRCTACAEASPETFDFCWSCEEPRSKTSDSMVN